MWEAENQLSAVLEELCDVLQNIEEEQISRFARQRSLSRLERYVRDTLLRLLESDFPYMATEYSELNRLYDDDVTPGVSKTPRVNAERMLVTAGNPGNTRGW